MNELSIALLGRPEVRWRGSLVAFRTRRALALLAYLAVEPGPHPRDELAALLWPESEPRQALIDRRLYRRKYDAARTLATFGAALRDDAAADLDDLSAHLLTAVDETMQPESVALWLVKRSSESRDVSSMALGEWMQVDQPQRHSEGPQPGPELVS